MSFVVPAHNEEAGLPRTLAAIQAEIARAGCPAEVIVVDDASTDGTARVAARFPGVRVVPEPVKGLSRARQAGFVASDGDLVANIDADTILPQGWLLRVLEQSAGDHGLVALSGPYIYHDVPLRVRAAVRAFYWLGFIAYAVNRHVLRTGSMLQGGNFVVARRALEEIGGFDPAFTFYGEDTDVARRLHAVGKVRFTFALPAYSSGRRFRGDGVFATGLRYGVNYLWATFRHRPFTREARDHRAGGSMPSDPAQTAPVPAAGSFDRSPCPPASSPGQAGVGSAGGPATRPNRTALTALGRRQSGTPARRSTGVSARAARP